MTAEDLADEEWEASKEKGKKGKKKGKRGKVDVDDEVDETVPEPSVDLEAKKPVEVTADDLADEEWGPVKDKKGKKGKKGKKQEGDDDAGMSKDFHRRLRRLIQDFCRIAPVLIASAPALEPSEDADEDGVGEPGTKVLSKKEKEKLKKEKEKVGENELEQTNVLILS